MHHLSEQQLSLERRYYDHIRRRVAPTIGNYAIKAFEVLDEGTEKRRYDEIFSGIVEAMPGIVETNYPFNIENGKIVAADKDEVGKMLERALVSDEQRAAFDSFYADFLPQRTRYELLEFYDIEAMANGERNFNSSFTFSPYSEEFCDTPEKAEKLRVANQKPHWKRSMVRAVFFDGEQVHIATRSIDNSSVQILKEVAKNSLDYEFLAENSTEMLGEQITRNITYEEFTELTDSIITEADRIISQNIGQPTIQGRPKNESANTRQFLEKNKNILGKLLQEGEELASRIDNFQNYQKSFDDKMYSYIALLEDMVAEKIVKPKESEISIAATISGAAAASEGRIYDMCGYVLGSKADSLATQTGFESLSRLANELEEKVAGKGSCSSCGAKGLLYGCGVFCKHCNKEWCNEYKKTGKQMLPQEIAKRRKINTRGKKEQESFYEWWMKFSNQEKTKTKIN